MCESPIAWGILLLLVVWLGCRAVKALLDWDKAQEEALEEAHKEWEAEFQ